MVETASFIRLQTHGATVSRHQPVCEIPGLLSVRFYLFIIIIIIIIIIIVFNIIYYIIIILLLLLLFFDPDVFYNLENENELLASMDIDHPVRIQGKEQYN